jgi:hypothetical protein
MLFPHLQSGFRTRFMGNSILSTHETLHIPRSNGSLVTAVIIKTKNKIPTPPLCLLHAPNNQHNKTVYHAIKHKYSFQGPTLSGASIVFAKQVCASSELLLLLLSASYVRPITRKSENFPEVGSSHSFLSSTIHGVERPESHSDRVMFQYRTST